jgi:UDP-N-acetyl-alpha-D-quinovosamine dehydrogenase
MSSQNQPPKLVLVTGANGFIGQATCRLLASLGMRVRAVVRQPGMAIDTQMVTHVARDIGERTDWRHVLDEVDAVVHLAAGVHGIDDTTSDPLALYRRTNTKRTLRLAEGAAVAGVRRFIFLSTIKVHGEMTEGEPFSEEDHLRPTDPYAVSKLEAEEGLFELSHNGGLEVVVLRPPLDYGPRVKANFLRLLRLVAQGIPLPLASVNNRRSLLYLDTLVSAMTTSLTHPDAAGRTYLVSDGEDVSTPELIRRIAGAMGKKARLLRTPPRLLRWAGAMLRREREVDRLLGSLVVDSRRIRRELGLSPSVEMSEGLRETVEWFRAVRG